MTRALLVLAIFASSPDPVLTPGKVDASVTKEVICSTRTRDRRKVTKKMRIEVARRYGVPYDSGKFETDHRAPLCAGGANDIENLWPQPWSEAREKDKIEVRTCRQLCRGEITLEQAQAVFLKPDAGNR